MRYYQHKTFEITGSLALITIGLYGNISCMVGKYTYRHVCTMLAAFTTFYPICAVAREIYVEVCYRCQISERDRYE